jgi:hypothetical protein
MQLRMPQPNFGGQFQAVPTDLRTPRNQCDRVGPRLADTCNISLKRFADRSDHRAADYFQAE